MARTQINIRIDDDLIAAMKLRCDEQGATQTDFIISAIKSALGMPIGLPGDVTLPAEVEERIAARIADVEHKLAARIADVEKKLAA